MRVRLALAAGALVLALSSSPATAQGDPLRERQWNHDMIEADAAHSVTTGAGAVVAVVDTGVLASHEDLRGRLLPGRDVVEGDGEPQDGDGHGTHVLGISAAGTGNGLGVASVAPGAGHMAIRVLDDDGGGSDQDVAEGIDYAVAAGAHVINLSLGDFVPLSAIGVPSATGAAIRRALDAGVVVVAASGNNGLPLCEQPPDSRMICVGSVDKRRARSAFSSSGDLMAPGGSGAPARDEGVLSTYNNGGYQEIEGTSQAAPHVSGAAALLVSLGLRGDAVKQRLLETASPAGPEAFYGAGIVNARAAVSGLPAAQAPSSSASRGSGVSMRRRQRARTLLRRGLRVRCKSPAAGRCTVTAMRKRRKVMFGSRGVAAGGKTTVKARATRYGKRFLRRTRRSRLRVKVAIPDARTRTLKLRVKGKPRRRR